MREKILWMSAHRPSQSVIGNSFCLPGPRNLKPALLQIKLSHLWRRGWNDVGLGRRVWRCSDPVVWMMMLRPRAYFGLPDRRTKVNCEACPPFLLLFFRPFFLLIYFTRVFFFFFLFQKNYFFIPLSLFSSSVAFFFCPNEG